MDYFYKMDNVLDFWESWGDFPKGWIADIDDEGDEEEEEGGGEDDRVPHPLSPGLPVYHHLDVGAAWNLIGSLINLVYLINHELIIN